LPALQALGPSFIKGYIGIANGEKDPRNLLVAFALDRVILLEFEVSDFIEVAIKAGFSQALTIE
jgi:DNA repair/transcription protein MET18/MMS19